MKHGLISVNHGDEDDIDSVKNTSAKIKGCIQQLMDQGIIQIGRCNKEKKGKDVAVLDIPYDEINM